MAAHRRPGLSYVSCFEPLSWTAVEHSVNLNPLRLVARNASNASALLQRPRFDDSAADLAVDVRSLSTQLYKARALSAPGFMTLHAVRSRNQIVDFEWDSASVAADWWLTNGPTGLVGKRLVAVLAGRAGRGEIFSQYWRAVEFGGARAVCQNIEFRGALVVLRHAPVRLNDGVAVTLTNLTAVRREIALEREISARMAMSATHDD